MSVVYPFRALRPKPEHASEVAAVPYDVVSTDEARALAAGHALSFLRISRAEIELPPGTNPYAEAVYERAAANFSKVRDQACVVEGEPSLYVYRLGMGDHEQVGLAACFSLDEYDHDLIKKHERTRRDKEDDRTRHMLALGAQTGPVLLMYRGSDEIDHLIWQAARDEALFDFQAADAVRHTIWRTSKELSDAIVGAFRRVPVLYIADGHHRAASAARARDEMRERRMSGTSFGDGADVNTLLAVAFPHNQMQILAYNRVVRDLARLTPAEFVRAVSERFTVEPGPATPRRGGEISMYFDGSWRVLRPRDAPQGADTISSLDVTILQDRLLAPVLHIGDVRTDKRIDFVGGRRGTTELERLVDSHQAAVAFSMFPVAVEDLMAVSDAGGIMPPKSTWFEPKLRDGLLIHLI